ncbi:MAG: HAMP domain-containing histidine kinase [Flavobacteriales bacterium]|nr:HAMP domain-containing histidine kinase [Flavobacteriales bacterium]
MKSIRLFTKLALLFFGLLLIVSGINLILSVRAAREYSLEVTQHLDKDLAANTVSMIAPLLDSSSTDAAIQDIMHSMMVINPSVEVYLLDEKGAILNYAAPDKVVKLKQVDLEPIKAFVDHLPDGVLYGDDPRTPGSTKIFSAAPIERNGQVQGYIYIVLASQEYQSAADMMFGSYILNLSFRSFVVILVIATLIGLGLIWLITRQLRHVIQQMRTFRDGDHSARINIQNRELADMTQTFNEMADTIQRQIEDLKSVDRLRQELVANISHDLRTPISSIQGFCELLSMQSDLTQEQQQEYLGIINKNVIKLKKLVNDLFELSKLEAGVVQPRLEPVNIAELVHDIASKYRLMAQDKGIHLNTIYSKELPLANADTAMIDRVLQNLVDNSLKFCEGGDTITIEIQQMENDRLNIKVSDSGKGIAEADLPFIFDRYYKGGDHDTKNGTGLGLAISRKMIELHGSMIQVKSQLHRGTEFSFWLPAL